MGNGWTERLPGVTGLTGKVRLKQNVTSQTVKSPPPPGADYVGEETQGLVMYHVYEIDPWVTLYKPWAERVNDAFEGWRTLPDPADFDTPITHLENAVDELTPAEQSDGGYTFVNVAVTNSLELMRRWISPQQGNSSELLFAFDSAYGVGRITGTMVNQAQVACGLGFTAAGEKKLWTAARADLMRIAGDAATAMDVSGGGGSFSIDLGVVKSFVDLVGVFVPKQYQILTSGLSAGIGFLEEIIPKQKTEKRELSVSGSTAEEICSSMEGAIFDLEQAIFHEEMELIEKLRALEQIIYGRSADDFHIHPGAGIDAGFEREAAIRMDSQIVRTIGTRDVPTVAAAYLRAADMAGQANTGEGIWTRENSIGMGTVGPYIRWSDALGVFDEMTTGSARELVEAGKLLAVAAGWIEGSDDESARILAGLDDELRRGELEWA